MALDRPDLDVDVVPRAEHIRPREARLLGRGDRVVYYPEGVPGAMALVNVNPAGGNYHLRQDASAAINQGSVTPGESATDIDGQDRSAAPTDLGADDFRGRHAERLRGSELLRTLVSPANRPDSECVSRVGTREVRVDLPKTLPLVPGDAVRVLREQGFDAAKMQDIATRARVSRALVYLYFKDKAELHFAIGLRALELLRARFQQARARHKTGLDQLRAIGHAYLVFAQEFPVYFQAISRFEGHQATPDEEGAQKRMMMAGRLVHAELITALMIGQQDGTIRKDD